MKLNIPTVRKEFDHLIGLYDIKECYHGVYEWEDSLIEQLSKNDLNDLKYKLWSDLNKEDPDLAFELLLDSVKQYGENRHGNDIDQIKSYAEVAGYPWDEDETIEMTPHEWINKISERYFSFRGLVFKTLHIGLVDMLKKIEEDL